LTLPGSSTLWSADTQGCRLTCFYTGNNTTAKQVFDPQAQWPKRRRKLLGGRLAQRSKRHSNDGLPGGITLAGGALRGAVLPVAHAEALFIEEAVFAMLHTPEPFHLPTSPHKHAHLASIASTYNASSRWCCQCSTTLQCCQTCTSVMTCGQQPAR